MSLENKVNKQLSKLKKRALDQLNKKLDKEFDDTSKSIIVEQRDIDLYKIELEYKVPSLNHPLYEGFFYTMSQFYQK